MSCLSINVQSDNINNKVKIDDIADHIIIKLIDKDLNAIKVETFTLKPIVIKTSTGEPIYLQASSRTPQINKLKVSLVCSIEEFRFLDVSPKDVFLFVANNNTAYAMITSNVKWIVS